MMLNRLRTRTQSGRRSFLAGAFSSLALAKFNPRGFFLSRPADVFEEIAPQSSGIRWVHTAGISEHKYLPESSGAGCAFLDYDNDGWMDIYLVNSGKSVFYDPKPPLRNALYRNNRDGTFSDVTEKAGVGGAGYGMGVAIGDYDNDGFPDIFLTQYGNCILYHNNGDGAFTDVTAKAGLAVTGWCTSAVWFDYDNDGRLDLFICRFVDAEKANHGTCEPGPDGKPHYCIPKIFPPMGSLLFRNNGDGTFTDVSSQTGIAKHLGKSWGVVATDINNDGWMDLFVANDTVPNFLFANRGGHFEEIGFTSNVAYSAAGRARSGMGIDSADYDEDGWMDFFLGNIDEEIFSLYHNNRDETFDDKSMAAGTGLPTRNMSGWGMKFFDYNNDGKLDIICANGFPDDFGEGVASDVGYRQPLLLLQNTGSGFKNVSHESGSVFFKTFSSRGLAIGDFNNDGAVDVLVLVNDGAPLLLRNNVGAKNHWLGVKLVGTKSNRDAIGARVVCQSGDFKANRMLVGGGSFLSSHDPRIVLGLGKRTKVDLLQIKWPQPSGMVERFHDLPIDRYITIFEGTGKWK